MGIGCQRWWTASRIPNATQRGKCNSTPKQLWQCFTSHVPGLKACGKQAMKHVMTWMADRCINCTIPWYPHDTSVFHDPGRFGLDSSGLPHAYSSRGALENPGFVKDCLREKLSGFSGNPCVFLGKSMGVFQHQTFCKTGWKKSCTTRRMVETLRIMG